MIITTQLCGRCASDQVRKNGSSGGRAKYQCKVCAYRGYLHLSIGFDRVSLLRRFHDFLEFIKI
ncbi:transposase-like zinc-binding domain-containing protein [Hymenobacter rubidus]